MADLDHWEAMFDSKYLRWFDIAGKEVTVEIVSCAKEMLTVKGGIKKVAPVVTMKGAQKQLVLNKTNAGSIASLHGSKPSSWRGKKVTLYQSVTDMYNSETKKMDKVNCIRVKEAK